LLISLSHVRKRGNNIVVVPLTSDVLAGGYFVRSGALVPGCCWSSSSTSNRALWPRNLGLLNGIQPRRLTHRILTKLNVVTCIIAHCSIYHHRHRYAIFYPTHPMYIPRKSLPKHGQTPPLQTFSLATFLAFSCLLALGLKKSLILFPPPRKSQEHANTTIKLKIQNAQKTP